MLMYLPTRIDDGSPPHAVPVANGLIITVNVLLFFLGFQWTVGPGSGLFSVVGYGLSHAGIGHLMINMWLLLLVGNVVNRRIGDGYYALLYFGTVITLGVFARFFAGQHLAGSSGAIFAIVAVLAILRPSSQTHVGYVVLFPLSVVWGLFARPAHWLYWIIRWDTLRLRAVWLLVLVPLLQLIGLLWWWDWTSFGHLFGFVCGIVFVLLLPDRIAKPGYGQFEFGVRI